LGDPGPAVARRGGRGCRGASRTIRPVTAGPPNPCRETGWGSHCRRAGSGGPLRAAGDEVGYPRRYDVDVVLRDGSTVHLRAAVPGDRDGLTGFLAGLSEQSKVFRFFHAVKEVAPLAAIFLDMDYRERFSVIALHGEPEAIVGHGFYAATGPRRAEVAFAVADAI
jgi:hypothetical protein